MFGLGTTELIIILVLVMIIFGAGKLPQVGGALGKGLRNFKDGVKEGDEEKSGGIATNIGIHLFDMLHFLFGKVQAIEVHYSSKTAICGTLEFSDAVVSWFLSVDFNDVPVKEKKAGLKTFRALEVDDYFMEFSGGFENLHSLSYERILSKNGFGIADARSAIETVYKIRHAAVTKPKIVAHPILKSLKNKI